MTKVYYRIELLKIKSVVPYNLYGSFASDKKLNNDEILALSKEIKMINRKGLEYKDCEKEIIKYLEQNYPSVSFNADGYKENDAVLHLSYELNVYNLFDCKDSDMIYHGGVTMLLELENGDTMYFCGD